MNLPIAFVRYPGAHLALADQDAKWDIDSLLRHMQLQLDRAAMALIMSMETASLGSDDDAEWDRRSRKLSIYRNIHQDSLVATEAFLLDDMAEGRIPRQYRHQASFIAGEGFVLAVDAIAKALRTLEKIAEASAAATNAHALLVDKLPSLKAVRDSIAHAEDRVLGKKKFAKPLPPGNLPGVRIIGGLDGQTYRTTTESGNIEAIPITVESLSIARDAIQTFVNGLTWSGPPMIQPM